MRQCIRALQPRLPPSAIERERETAYPYPGGPGRFDTPRVLVPNLHLMGSRQSRRFYALQLRLGSGVNFALLLDFPQISRQGPLIYARSRNKKGRHC